MNLIDEVLRLASQHALDSILPGLNGALCRWPQDIELAESAALRMGTGLSDAAAVAQAFDAALVGLTHLFARMRSEGDAAVRDAIQSYHLAGVALGVLSATTGARIDRVVQSTGMDAAHVRRSMESAAGGQTERIIAGLAAGMRQVRARRPLMVAAS